jgi:hypothetical protein
MLLIACTAVFFYAQSGWAGTVSLEIRSNATVRDQQVHVKYAVVNQGEEEARDVFVEAVFRQQKRSTWVADRIAAGQTRRATIIFHLSQKDAGSYPVFTTVRYSGRDGSSHSIAALTVAAVSGPQAHKLDMSVTWKIGVLSSTVIVNLNDPDADVGCATLNYHHPDNLAFSEPKQQVWFKDGRARAETVIQNRQGSAGDRYGIFITAEYEKAGIQGLASKEVLIKVQGTEKEGWDLSARHVATVMGGGVVVVL